MFFLLLNALDKSPEDQMKVHNDDNDGSNHFWLMIGLDGDGWMYYRF